MGDSWVQRIFTSEDGLLSTSTQEVVQTSEGFIWIGGYGGLVRYDGKRFETFAYKRITRVTDMVAGEDGELWVATSDKGVFHYADNAFSAAAGGEGLDVECMAFSPDGTLYLGTNDGLCTVANDQIQRVGAPGLEGEKIDRLLIPEPGRILCVTVSGELCAWDGEALRRVDTNGEFSLRSVCLDPSGGFLAGTSGDEVIVLDDALNVVDRMTMAGLNCINDLQCDEDGAIWPCADNGIFIYVDGSVRMQNLRMNNSVDKMLVDREGNHWFVSSRQGALEVSRSKFGDVSQCAGLDPMVVNAIQRIGGDEFLILSRGVEGDAMRARLDAMAAEGEKLRVDGLPVTFACGLCIQRSGEFDFEEGLRLSDLRMLEAKSRFHSRDQG